MKLEIVEVNFIEEKDWLVKLTNNDQEIYYVMNSSFYSFYNLKFPLSKKEFDFYAKGIWIDAEAKFLNGKNVVSRVY
ncbi:hypothetical protein PQ465_20445 [Sphingobacterium oryzagri]|uniref:Uncharacterized protein n=1 Tax=Sphingobacterium oryzagri TaxID=3025669 RepID=A0ABY7WJA4_9SPHI|nr:hypothetical protein [Sphingobacterium sp. KACC 22765]WDF68652.1 hypothetical protein PQ465_20445 [Sphingobacterium sp. KACC 22765]